MTALWFVVDTITGDRFEPGHLEQCDAYRAFVDKVAGHDEDVTGRYDIDHRDADEPGAYAVPAQILRSNA